ncbi:MAG: hypothetical protein Q9186_002978 [Xanthomendoza sp. 1 TL-2023]
MSIPPFATIFPRSRLGRPLDALEYKHRAKRKRDEDSSEQSRHDDPAPLAFTPLRRTTTEEYRTAGQPSDQSTPPFPFPHASSKEHRRASLRHEGGEIPSDRDSESSYDTTSQSDDEESEAKVMPNSSSGGGLRQQHYTVLTTLLHRCLLEKDYVRASRAWGILLRLELNGHPLNIRLQERWGIGAELLLRGDGASGTPKCEGAHLSPESLMGAKDYYERLILQYPFRKTSPDSPSSLTFYPVMFGIWIYSIQLRYKITVQDTVRPSADRGRTRLNATSDSGLEYSDPANVGIQIDVQLAARRTAFQQAQEVSERLRELLISPPYSDHSGLWKILGNLCLWLNQLSDHTRTSLSSTSSREDHSTSPTASLADSDLHTMATKSATKENYPGDEEKTRSEALLNAKEAFGQALKLGGMIDPRTRRAVAL